MSKEATTWAWHQQAHSTAKLILLCLADIVDSGAPPVVQCSVTYLARRTCLCRKTVIRQIKNLEVLDFLSVNRSVGADGRAQMNLYELLIRGQDHGR